MESKKIQKINKIKYSKWVNITKKKQTHRYREETVGDQWGEGGREGPIRDQGLRGTNYYI